MSYEVKGTIKSIGETQTITTSKGELKKRELVIIDNEKYPQLLKFDLLKDVCNVLDNAEPLQEITVFFNIKGNEYKDKIYVNLQAWKVELESDSRSLNTSTAGQDEPISPQNSSGDLPF